MKKFLVTIACILPSMVWAQANPAVIVNGVTIPGSYLDFLVAQAPDTSEDPNQLMEYKHRVMEQLIRSQIIVQEAQKRGLDKKEEVLIAMDISKQDVLIRAFVAEILKDFEIKEVDIKKEYETMKSQMGDKELLLHHILVKTEPEAKKVLAELNRGKSFASLAKKYSEDPGSKKSGGVLGWNTPGVFVPEFSKAALAMSKGEVSSSPVATPFGYHILYLEDVREFKGPDLDQVRPQVEDMLRQHKLQEVLEELRAAAKIEFKDTKVKDK